MTSNIMKLGHSPDSDDAFMFWALAEGKVKTNLRFEHILKDIQTLNDWAHEGKLETTAISVHAYAYVADKYALLRHGGSFGDGYGPMLVAKKPMSMDELSRAVIAIPGRLTSAYLALRLYIGNPNVEVVPFDEIMPAVQSGKYQVGLIIHEGQLTSSSEGLTTVADLGEWWKKHTHGLPLPLGVNVVRKDLGAELMNEISNAMRESIRIGLEQRSEALNYALQFGRGLDAATADKFVGMYVNELTADMGERGTAAISEFLTQGAALGIVPPVKIEFV